MAKKAGLLICDHVADEFRHINGEYLDMFKNLLPSLELEPYYVVDGHFPDSVNDHDAYICNGSLFSVYDTRDWIQKLTDFIREIGENEKKYVGVCFGHQMMGHAMGGKVEKAEVGWCVGVHEFELLDKKDWMVPSLDSYNLLMLCQDQVVQLPPNSEVIAMSKDCEVSMLLVNECMLGIQGHPEFSKAYNKTLIEKRVKRIGEEKAEKAIQSLVKPIDNEIVAQWIMNFIGGD